MRRPDEIPVLIAEIASELAKLEALVGKLSGQMGHFGTEETMESVALRLHNLYTGCERIFKIIANELNGGLPESEEWHKRLLSQMALDVDEARPAVITHETENDLAELLAFRHVVRNLYGYELKVERVGSLAQLALRVFPRFAREVRAFLDFLRKLHQQT